ncbi:MAG: filamentous hemagglutinin N-terminal domain-containing protein, partial [Burkholderiales bacterium]|nr:filamentous hemagglutinin N-terminal domain-containing protein [Burkholderiales bacterium]
MKAASINHIFRLVWSDHLQGFVAVPEGTRSRGKRGGGRALTRAAGAVLAVLAASQASAAGLPTGGQIAQGTGSISQAGNTLTVNQTSSKLLTNWQSFSVGAGNTVNFVQPGASAVALNNVLGSDVSVIQGAINANGQVFLLNPNGVLFTPTAQVNVGSLVASTLTMSTSDFMAGNYRFSGASANAVVNQGNIVATGDGSAGGSIALIAAKITNDGSLTAKGGNVLLGAGSDVTLDLGGPVQLQVNKGAIDALVANGGAIQADGGVVYLTAQALDTLTSAVINNTGVIRAQTLATGAKGDIRLIADMRVGTVNVGGTLDASAPQGGDGG